MVCSKVYKKINILAQKEPGVSIITRVLSTAGSYNSKKQFSGPTNKHTEEEIKINLQKERRRGRTRRLAV